VPETCFPIRPSNGRGVSKDRHAAYLIKARRTNLHPKAGYIDADFLSLNFSLAFTRRTIHLGNYHPLQSEVAENQRHFGKDEQPGRIDDPLRYVA
jgi:hypothetical protein